MTPPCRLELVKPRLPERIRDRLRRKACCKRAHCRFPADARLGDEKDVLFLLLHEHLQSMVAWETT